MKNLNLKKCDYCNKELDVSKEYYAHSKMHGWYMHLDCFRKYEIGLMKISQKKK